MYVFVMFFSSNHFFCKKSPNLEWYGVCHGDELPAVLGDGLNENPPFSKVEYTEVDRALTRQLLKYWTNFVKSGDANLASNTSTIDPTLPEWPQYKSVDGWTMELKGRQDKQSLIPSYKTKDCHVFYFYFCIQFEVV